MGNWSERQEIKQERKERDKTSRETLGKFFYDLAKLVFTAMALVGGVSLIIEDAHIKQFALLAAGLFFTFMLAYRLQNIKRLKYGLHDCFFPNRLNHSHRHCHLDKHQKR